MARNQKLINYHTGDKTRMPSGSSVDYGEIVVRHNAESPELLIKIGDDSFGVFQASGAVQTAINSAKSELNTSISNLEKSLSGHVATFEQFQTNVQNTYATKEELKSTSGSIISAYTTAIGAAKKEIYDSATSFTTTEVNTLNTSISDVRSSLNELSGVVESISTNIGENYVTTGVLNTKVTELKTEISTAKDDAISSGKTYTDAQITAAKKYTDDQIKTSETTTNGLIEGVKTDLGEFKTTVETDYVLKTTLNTKVSELEGKISKAQKDATDASSAYTDTQIAAAKEYSDGKLSAATETLKGSIADVKSDVTTLSGNVETAIDNLESTLTETINNKVAVAYRYQGTVTNYADLPTSNMSSGTVGYVYNVENANGNYPAGTNYAWNGTKWDALGGSVDLSPYATTTYVDDEIKKVNKTNTDLKSDIDNLSAATESFSAATVATYATKDELKSTSGSIITAYTNAIAAAKKEAIGTASGYTDAQVLAAKDSVYLSATTAAAADAKTKADTAYSSAVTAAAASANTLQNNIDTVNSSVTGLSASTIIIQGVANSAIQNASIVDSATCKVSVNKEGTELQFDFRNLVVDCGDF